MLQRNIYKNIKKVNKMLREWNDLPNFMKCDEVKEYYDILVEKKLELKLKRLFDVVMSFIFIIFFSIPMLIIAVMIKMDSQGPVFYRQERITTYGKRFRIHKFRTMINNADKIGAAVTVSNDNRITKVGVKLRKLRLDELPQLFDIITGNMSFVGTRPESLKYVKMYTKEMRATLLLPAGITSEASIRYKDESRLLDVSDDIDNKYIEKILPEKMNYNLESIKKFSLGRELIIMFKTIFAVLGKEYF